MSGAFAWASVKWVPAVALVLVLASPMHGQAVSAPTAWAPATLNVHPINWQDFPINTQPAAMGDTVDDFGTGLGFDTLTCVPNPPAGVAAFQEYHVWRGYSSPGPVEYDFVMDHNPRVASERQMGYDGNISKPVLHWFLETTPGAPGVGPADLDQAPLVVPNVVVEATLRASDPAISVDDKAYDSGTILAHGMSAPALLAEDQSQGVTHTMVGGHHVYELTIPMDVAHAEIGLLGFTLRIDAHLDNPACTTPDQEAMPNLVRPFADADHRPRIELEVSDPIRILALAPRFTNTSVVVEAQAQSVWGNHDIDLGLPSGYDVDEARVTLSIDGPGRRFELPPSAIVQRMHEYYHHADPVVFEWDLPRADFTPGLHWLNLTVHNDQHTASATAHAAFRIGPDQAYAAPPGGGMPDVSLPTQPVPSLGAPALLAVLALAVCMRKGSIGNR